MMMTMMTMQAYPAALERIKKLEAHVRRKAPENFFVVPLHFLALQVQSVVLVSASVWPVQFDHFLVFCSSYSRCPRAQSFVKVWALAPVPSMESVSLSCYQFHTRKHYKTSIQSECIASQGLFSQCLLSKLRTE